MAFRSPRGDYYKFTVLHPQSGQLLYYIYATDTEDIDSYDVGDPYEDEILVDSDKPADDGEEDV